LYRPERCSSSGLFRTRQTWRCFQCCKAVQAYRLLQFYKKYKDTCSNKNSACFESFRCLHAKELLNTNPFRGIDRQLENPLYIENISFGFYTVSYRGVGIFCYTNPTRSMRSSSSCYTALHYTVPYLYRP